MDLIDSHGVWDWEILVGESAWSDRLPTTLGGRCDLVVIPWFHRGTLAAGVSQLNSDQRALTMDEVDRRLERFSVLITPDTRAADGNSSIWHHSSRLNHDHADAAGCEGSKMDDVPGSDDTIIC